MKNDQLIKNGIILSLPGLLSICVSLISIPIHLKIAGVENYGNYVIFHFLLTISTILNFGIGKSIVISMNNFYSKKKMVAYQGLNYTFNVCFLISIIFIFLYLLDIPLLNYFFKTNIIFGYFIICSVCTISYLSFEGILQGNEKYKHISFFNFVFFSLSLALPSILLFFFNQLKLEDLLLISTFLKIISVSGMIFLIKINNFIKKSQSNILKNNLKKNSKWLTSNGILIQFYDIFDKYLVKIFLGPIALATYSIPQQLTGKLSIFSKGFGAILLTILSKKKGNKIDFNKSIKIFLIIIPTLILLMFPIYSILLNFWLGSEYNKTILALTKIFSISGIFACSSHILISKFEASKSLKRNLKFEFMFMPFFLLGIYYLTSGFYSLLYISFFILAKELALLFLRLNLLKREIKNINTYYLYSLIFIFMLYLSFKNENLFFLFETLLIINIFRND